jgi:uracil-DNA glycosylase
MELPNDYSYFYGNPVNPVVPVQTARKGILIIGAYPTARFGKINSESDVPLYDISAPFSNESYFDGSKFRWVKSGIELEEKYLIPLGIKKHETWLTNLVKVFLFKKGHVEKYYRLGRKNFQETRSNFGEIAEKSKSFIYEEINIAKPKVIITLGEEVTAAILDEPKSKAKKLFDGRFHEDAQGNEIIALPHPGIVMRKQSNNPWPEQLPKLIEKIKPQIKERLGN